MKLVRVIFTVPCRVIPNLAVLAMPLAFLLSSAAGAAGPQDSSPANACASGLSASNGTTDTANSPLGPLLDNLTREERAAIALQPGDKHLIDAVANNTNAARWGASLFDRKKTDQGAMLRAALAAAQNRKITLGQFTTLVLRWQVQDDIGSLTGASPFQAHALLTDEGALTPFAIRVFESRPHPEANFKYQIHASKALLAPGLGGEALERFRRNLLALPPSERFSFSLDIPEATIDNMDGPLKTGIGVLKLTSTESFFTRKDLLETGSYTFMAHSFGAIQAFLDALFPGVAVRLLPHLGEIGMEGIIAQEGRGERVFGLYFPGFNRPCIADSYTISKSQYSNHDVLHAYTGSFMPVIYRKLMPPLVALLDAPNAIPSATALYIKHMFADFRSQEAYFDARNYKHPARVMTNDLFNYQTRLLTGVRGIPQYEASPHNLGVAEGPMGLLLADMARNPKKYEELGIDLEAFVNDLIEPQLVKVYRTTLETIRSRQNP